MSLILAVLLFVVSIFAELLGWLGVDPIYEESVDNPVTA